VHEAPQHDFQSMIVCHKLAEADMAWGWDGSYKVQVLSVILKKGHRKYIIIK